MSTDFIISVVRSTLCSVRYFLATDLRQPMVRFSKSEVNFISRFFTGNQAVSKNFRTNFRDFSIESENEEISYLEYREKLDEFET